MGGKSEAPQAPDYTSAAKATAQGNLDMARLNATANRVNTYTPFGDLTYTQGSPTRTFNQNAFDTANNNWQSAQSSGSPVGGSQYDWTDPMIAQTLRAQGISPDSSGGLAQNPGTAAPDRNSDQFWTSTPSDQWSSKVSLSPQQQQLLDANQGSQLKLAGLQDTAANRVGDAQSTPFSLSGARAGGQVYDPSKSTNDATDLILQRLAPSMDRQQSGLNQDLANQGLTMGSKPWQVAQTQLGQTQNDQRIAASLAGINLGMQQSQLGFGQGQIAHGSDISDMLMQRNQPLNELNALRSGTQITMPQFPNAPAQQNVAGANYSGAAGAQYQSAADATNIANANSQSQFNGAASLGTLALLAFSDRRVKKNLVRVGTLSNGLGAYEYDNEITGGREIGVMAQEVARTQPHAVHIHENGLLMVDYGALK